MPIIIYTYSGQSYTMYMNSFSYQHTYIIIYVYLLLTIYKPMLSSDYICVLISKYVYKPI